VGGESQGSQEEREGREERGRGEGKGGRGGKTVERRHRMRGKGGSSNTNSRSRLGERKGSEERSEGAQVLRARPLENERAMRWATKQWSRVDMEEKAGSRPEGRKEILLRTMENKIRLWWCRVGAVSERSNLGEVGGVNQKAATGGQRLKTVRSKEQINLEKEKKEGAGGYRHIRGK